MLGSSHKVILQIHHINANSLKLCDIIINNFLINLQPDKHDKLNTPDQTLQTLPTKTQNTSLGVGKLFHLKFMSGKMAPSMEHLLLFDRTQSTDFFKNLLSSCRHSSSSPLPVSWNVTPFETDFSVLPSDMQGSSTRTTSLQE